MYLTSYVIINFYSIFPLFLTFCIYTIISIAIVITLSFIYLTHSVCKGKGLRFYFFFIWDLFSLLPLGIKIVIFIRLFLLVFGIFKFELEYNLNMLPNHGDFSKILGTTVAGPGPNGTNLPPTGGAVLGVTNNPSGLSILQKIELQGQERKGLHPTSVYSTTAFSPAATLTTAERYHLGILVGDDENNGTSGIYNTWIKKDLNGINELRVVVNPHNKPLSWSLDDARSTADFRSYLRKFT